MDKGGIDYPITRVQRTNRCPQSKNYGKLCDGQLIDTTLDPINPDQKPFVLVPHAMNIESLEYTDENGHKLWRSRYLNEEKKLVITAIRATQEEADHALGKALPEYIGDEMKLYQLPTKDKRFEEINEKDIPNLPPLEDI